jgi:hypothetical protein
MGRACSMDGEKWNPYTVLVEKARIKENTGNNTRARGDITKRDLRQDWIVWTRLIWLRVLTSGFCESVERFLSS